VKRYDLIYAAVRKIPRGRVSTYGWIAELAGLEGHARQVGYALHALPPNSGVPWQRVINAKGEISLPAGSDSGELQRILLAAEGVTFDERGRVDLARFGWRGRVKKLKSEFRSQKSEFRKGAKA
jgi:methylated-DNA-protein-cysteine methyltransferase-like protein